MPTQTLLNTVEAIQTRRAVKRYDPDFAMPQADMETLLSLTLLSPTSFNIQNWRLVLVTAPEIKQQLREAAWNQAQITDSSFTVVFCADLRAAEKNPERYWKNAPAEIQNTLVPMLENFYKDKPQLQRDEAMRSCGLAAQTLMLAARSMGYDSCPMVGFDPVEVAKIIDLPEDHVIALMVTVGKALEPARPRGGQLPYHDVVIQNRFTGNS